MPMCISVALSTTIGLILVPSPKDAYSSGSFQYFENTVAQYQSPYAMANCCHGQQI